MDIYFCLVNVLYSLLILLAPTLKVYHNLFYLFITDFNLLLSICLLPVSIFYLLFTYFWFLTVQLFSLYTSLTLSAFSLTFSLIFPAFQHYIIFVSSSFSVNASFIFIIGLRKTKPTNKEITRNIPSFPSSIQYTISYIPPTASLKAAMLCVNGSNGYTALKKPGATSIGKVPPAPATWTTSRITLMAFLCRQKILSMCK